MAVSFIGGGNRSTRRITTDLPQVWYIFSIVVDFDTGTTIMNMHGLYWDFNEECPWYTIWFIYTIYVPTRGRIQGGAHPARAPPKIRKNMIFWRKIDFSHEIPQDCSLLPPLGAIFLSALPYLEILDTPVDNICIRWETDQKCSPKTLVDSVIVSVLASSAVYRGFESRSGQTMFCTHILPSSIFCWKFMI